MDNGFDQDGLFKGINPSPNLAKTGTKILIKKKGAFAAIIIAIVGAGACMLLVPMLIIGTIKENLFSKLGFKSTVAILEKVAEYKIANYLGEGHMPEKLANDFALGGIEVGQTTLAGDFIRTNDYIADLNGAEIAASGEYQNHEIGALVVRFGNMIINADNFVATVESTPELYAAYSETLDIGTRFYYSDDVNAIYKNMGINRNAFGSWKPTGDSKADEESFNEILAKLLDGNFSVNTSSEYLRWEREYDEAGNFIGCTSDWEPWSSSTTGDAEETAGNLISGIAGGSRWNRGNESTTLKLINRDKLNQTENENIPDNLFEYKELGEDDYYSMSVTANQNAAQLLNTTISSAEPYLAANTFMGIVEPIEQAQVGNNGSINYLMNALTNGTELPYLSLGNAEKGSSKSILETGNFMATVGDNSYSKEEANYFSRDRALVLTGLINEDAINTTVVSADNRKQSGLGIVMHNTKECDNRSASSGRFSDTNVAVFVEKNSKVFRSVAGGNRAVEGGSFLSNNINRAVLGAMPSDSNAIVAYQKEVNEVLARQAEADRATKSPFDVSSPNTFMGSLVRSIASTTMKLYNTKGNISLSNTVNAVTDLAGNSIKNLMGTAVADGSEDEFTTIAGDCETVKIAANVEGDLYCNSHNTLSTINMNYTDKDWQNAGIGVSADGEINEDSELAKFKLLAMDRESTVGVRSYEVCDLYIENYFNIFQKIYNFITTGAGQLDQRCNNVPLAVANGTIYTFSDKNVTEDGTNEPRKKAELYSAYVTHDLVTSLLEEKESNIAAFSRKYYEKHPRDESYEGKLARISGLSKNEVSVALAYAEHLSTIANYNPSNRYTFGQTIKPTSQKILIDDGEVRDAIYYAWFSRISYYDVRNRVTIA